MCLCVVACTSVAEINDLKKVLHSIPGVLLSCALQVFCQVASLKQAVPFSKVPKIHFRSVVYIGSRLKFCKHSNLLCYSHFYFAFNTHDIWELFFLSKICQQKVSGISRLSKKPKSRSVQFQNLIFNERRTLFSPLKYINFILLVNLNFFFQKRFI